jgi:two-component system LytT family response regulator
MTKIKTLIIDDEPKALSILENKINRFCPNLDIVDKTQNPTEAIDLIRSVQPDLIFLDIAMPEIDGFQVLKAIEDPNFEVIFATAFDNYAIEAIKHCAIGYLVKPIDNEDLVEAVNNAILNIEEKTALQKNKQLIENLGAQTFQDKKIVIPSQEGLEFVKIADIIHLEGENGYTKIHFINRKFILSSHSIGHFNKLLESKSFYLIHKSHLINLSYILKYLNDGYVVLEQNFRLPVSRNRRQEFLQNLKG